MVLDPPQVRLSSLSDMFCCHVLFEFLWQQQTELTNVGWELSFERVDHIELSVVLHFNNFKQLFVSQVFLEFTVELHPKLEFCKGFFRNTYFKTVSTWDEVNGAFSNQRKLNLKHKNNSLKNEIFLSKCLVKPWKKNSSSTSSHISFFSQTIFQLLIM